MIYLVLTIALVYIAYKATQLVRGLMFWSAFDFEETHETID